MKVKSSNKFPVVFLTIIGGMALLLWNFQSNIKVEDKYPETPLTEQTTTLDLVQITINEKSFNKLKKKRDKAVSVGILETEDSDFVPATIAFNGKEYKAEIRLKGDWTIHLEGDKWSFRVKLKDDQTILGMRKFSLHHPSTRRFLNEWLYHKAMKKEGLMGLRYNFVEGKIHISNGRTQSITKDVGIYAIEETFDKRTIESNKRKESIILKFSEDYWWNEVKKSKAIADQYGLSYSDFMNYGLITEAKYPIVPFGESKVLADTIMHDYFKFSKNLLEDLRNNRIMVSDAFDVDKLAMDTALMNLFGAVHGTFAINTRYYYNPITSRLEPISFDGNSGVKLNQFRNFVYKGKARDTAYFKALAKALNKVSSPQYVDDLININQTQIEDLTKILSTEFRAKPLNEENLRFNQNIMRAELKKLKEEFKLTELVTPEIEKFNVDDALSIDLSNSKLWSMREAEVASNGPKLGGQSSVKISRMNTTNAGFARFGNIEVEQNDVLEVSAIVRKSSQDGLFGLRIQSIYPNRADALFNLLTGEVSSSSKEGSYSMVDSNMESLGNGWYLCTLRTKPNSSKVNVIFGPSGARKKSNNWEGPTQNKSSIYLIPESLELKRF